MDTSKWEKVILRDICERINYGYTASATSKAVGPKFLRITDIVPDLINWEAVPFCEINERDLPKYELQAGDIVIARTGATTGYAKHIRNHPRSVFASYLVRIRLKHGINSRCIGFVLESEDYKRFIKANLGGAAQPQANAQVLTSYPLFLPSPSIQRKIASILSAYDDLIENNTRRIAILEEMAQYLYQEWFVHFRFSGHEKKRMIESQLGLIPEGWEVVKLGNVITLQRGFDLPASHREKGEFPIYAATGINGTHTQMKVKGPGVVTGRSGSIGTVLYVKEDFWPLNTTLWVKNFHRSTATHTFYLLRGINLGSFNSGAAVPTLNRNDVHNVEVVLPPINLINEFDQLVAPIFEMKRTLSKRNENLRRTRDLLLPKLISGEIDMERLDVEVGEEASREALGVS